MTNISLQPKDGTQTEISPKFTAGGNRARKKGINFELKFCAKFYIELSEMDEFLTLSYV